MANPFEAATARGDVRFQHRVDPIPQLAVGMADDAGAGTQGAKPAGLAFLRCFGDEDGLTHWAQVDQAVREVFGPALDEHGRQDVVSGLQVGDQIFQQIAIGPRLPEVMMRVDDRQLRFQHRLRQHRQPARANPRMMERLALDGLTVHCISPGNVGLSSHANHPMAIPGRDCYAACSCNCSRAMRKADSSEFAMASAENRAVANASCAADCRLQAVSSSSTVTTAAANANASVSMAAMDHNPGSP